ncbi:hypothetical protein BOX15_Mlig008868g1, partial [Macrostomum lignano]
SRNHQEALHRRRFLERKRDAIGNNATSASRDLPVYEPKESDEIDAAPVPQVYGWKHGEKIRHRKLDNQPRDQMTRLIKLTDAQLQNSSSSAVSTPKTENGRTRKKHFKV